MATWSTGELQRIAEADDLLISPLRDDGVTHGTPTWIWSVAVDGALYVRGYNGQKSRWYQAAIRQKAGRSTAAGTTTEVTFEPVDESINDRIDEAYRARYRSSPYLTPMIGARARSATVRVVPQDAAPIIKNINAQLLNVFSHLAYPSTPDRFRSLLRIQEPIPDGSPGAAARSSHTSVEGSD
jgi:hypothetical protein